MLHWLPVTQGSDQYWDSRAAEQAGRALDREYAPQAVQCFDEGLLYTVANTVQSSQCVFSFNRVQAFLLTQMYTEKKRLADRHPDVRADVHTCK